MKALHYIIRPMCNGVKGWVAFGKFSPFVAGGDLVHETGDVWFQFGATEQEAREKIEAEMKAMLN